MEPPVVDRLLEVFRQDPYHRLRKAHVLNLNLQVLVTLLAMTLVTVFYLYSGGDGGGRGREGRERGGEQRERSKDRGRWADLQQGLNNLIIVFRVNLITKICFN